MKRVILFEKRKKARELSRKGWTNLKIARYLLVSKDAVARWVEMDEDEIEHDRRGGRQGRPVKYSDDDRSRILAIRRQLEQQSAAGIGSAVIKRIFKRKYGREVSEWFINKTLKETRIELEAPDEATVAARRTEWSAAELKRWGKIIMSLEFWGTSAGKSHGPPTYFLSCKYLYPGNLGIVSQIAAQTSEEVIRILKYIWRLYLKPDLVKMSFHSAFGVGLPRPYTIGKLAICLLNLGIKPYYTAAPDMSEPFDTIDLDKPANVFSNGFRYRLSFPSRSPAPFKIENFHLEYREERSADFERLKLPEISFKSIFSDVDIENRSVNLFPESRIYFSSPVRAGRGFPSSGCLGFVKILSVDVDLDREWIDSTVLGKLDVKKKLYLYHHREGTRYILIKRIFFQVDNLDYR